MCLFSVERRIIVEFICYRDYHLNSKSIKMFLLEHILFKYSFNELQPIFFLCLLNLLKIMKLWKLSENLVLKQNAENHLIENTQKEWWHRSSCTMSGLQHQRLKLVFN